MNEEREFLTAKEFSEITNKHFIDLSLRYAGQYQINPKNFITCFLKYGSIRQACAWITKAYKHCGAFSECLQSGKDFSEWVNKQKLEEKWKPVLAEVLLIIYSVINDG